MTRLIEARYHVEVTHLWEIEEIEDWPRDSHGPLPLESAHDYYIKWGLLHVQWEKDGHRFEYEPTYEGNGDGEDYKWPDVEYIDGKEIG